MAADQQEPWSTTDCFGFAGPGTLQGLIGLFCISNLEQRRKETPLGTVTRCSRGSLGAPTANSSVKKSSSSFSSSSWRRTFSHAADAQTTKPGEESNNPASRLQKKTKASWRSNMSWINGSRRGWESMLMDAERKVKQSPSRSLRIQTLTWQGTARLMTTRPGAAEQGQQVQSG